MSLLRDVLAMVWPQEFGNCSGEEWRDCLSHVRDEENWDTGEAMRKADRLPREDREAAHKVIEWKLSHRNRKDDELAGPGSPQHPRRSGSDRHGRI